MSKQLYEEALADVRQVKQVAEDNAKRAVLEAVTPRIREFIDQAMLDDIGATEPGAPPIEGELLTDLVDVDGDASVSLDNAGPAAGVSPPDGEGKVTLDLDALCVDDAGAEVEPPMFGASARAEVPTEMQGPGTPPGLGPQGGTEYEINLESIAALRPLAQRASINARMKNLVEQVKLFRKASKIVKSTHGYHEHISQLISQVEDMYDYVQEQVKAPKRKSSYENLLEASYKVLTTLQESKTMSKKTMQKLNEEDVTLKLTGLPDDINYEDVGVDLVTGDEEGEGDEVGDELAGGDEEGGFDDLDFGDEESQQGGDQQMESRRLSDDTIVEIDEGMLRREIARMRTLREAHTGTGGSETKPQSWGNGADHFDAFGGGKDEGEFDEQEIVDQSPSPGALPLGEADEDLDEVQAQMDEMDLDQAIDGPQHGGDDHMPSNKQSRAPGESFAVTRQEGLKRLGFEKKLQERAKSRAALLKKEAASARTRNNGRRLAAIKNEYAIVARRFNESVSRAKKVALVVAKATKMMNEARSNSGATRLAGNGADDTLRRRLAETNLFNAKLLYTNKLLQNEQLTARQKAQVIKQLDTVKTVREAKLVYESLASTLAGSSKPMTEGRDRAVLGSGSRATRPASTQTLNEGHEAERWARLAGITK